MVVKAVGLVLVLVLVLACPSVPLDPSSSRMAFLHLSMRARSMVLFMVTTQRKRESERKNKSRQVIPGIVSCCQVGHWFQRARGSEAKLSSMCVWWGHVHRHRRRREPLFPDPIVSHRLSASKTYTLIENGRSSCRLPTHSREKSNSTEHRLLRGGFMVLGVILFDFLCSLLSSEPPVMTNTDQSTFQPLIPDADHAQGA
ncbi:hypothetical protein AAFF_G00107450 [Aldrovandia affinis]|uniref:Secreted protein n=1 Tax=Aldrovandia affinis TaxID=143900 RepID=A0AAD7RWJ3_9TELE|nr:hypothetical protein AAFF_G00107450 [Aldrovandia affinis]